MNPADGSGAGLPRHWAIDSRLNSIPNRQTRRNEVGRARLTGEGKLRDCNGGQHSPSPTDSHCLIVQAFLDSTICDQLCEASHDLSMRISNRAPGFWDGRFIWHWDVAEAYPVLAAQMREGQRSAAALITDFYRLTAPIYPDLLQIMSWPVGIHMPPHADNANPDGSPHAMAHRDFSGIVYLNDDYRGGEFYFTVLDTVIKPKKGMLVAFTAGFYHEHAVLRVEGSQRLTMPFFLTFNKDRADPLLL
jgi:2OG-Fe(II) oxygenase superfamily